MKKPFVRRAIPRVFLPALLSCIAAAVAHAVVVRGTVRDPLGRPLNAVHVQLISGQQVIASTITLDDGTYEIRSTESAVSTARVRE